MQSVYQLATSVATPSSSIAAVDIQNSGVIQSILILMTGLSTAGADAGQRLQLSFGSTQSSANDTRQVIANCAMWAPLNAAAQPLGNWIMINCDIPVEAGERIFIHTTALGTVPASVTHLACIYVTDKSAGRSRFRQ